MWEPDFRIWDAVKSQNPASGSLTSLGSSSTSIVPRASRTPSETSASTCTKDRAFTGFAPVRSRPSAKMAM